MTASTDNANDDHAVPPGTDHAAAGQSPVLIVGVMNRCGTNFLAEAMKQHPVFASPPIAHEDYLLEHADLLCTYAQRTTQRWDRQALDERVGGPDHLVGQLGRSLLDYLQQFIEPGRRLLLKTPRPLGLDHYLRLFGHCKLVLLLRDGRDVSESAARSFPHAPHGEWMRRWADGADRLRRFVTGPGRDGENRQWLIVRYENMLADLPAVMKRLLAFVEADQAAFDWRALSDLPLRGSSTVRGASRTIHWKPMTRPADFQPLCRWADWPWWRRWQFHRIAGRQLIDWQYEPDARWVWRRPTRRTGPDRLIGQESDRQVA